MFGKSPLSQSPLVGSKSLIVVIGAFVCSRLLYFAAGIRFDLSPLVYHWQLIDPQLMRTDLLRSLFYLHMQPLGFNLLVGLVVKLLPHAYGVAFQILYLLMGLLIAILLLRLLRMLGVASWVATALTTLFVISPGSVLFENILAYDYVVLLLLLLAAICFVRLYESVSLSRAVAFFACVFGLVMIRNQFHLIYFLMILGAMLWTLPLARRTVLQGAAVFLVPILALHVKNWILFGSFTLSTWAGMNSAAMTTFQLTPPECEALIARGVLSPLARIPAFNELSMYREFVRVRPPTGIPILDMEVTSTGHPNFNNPAYLPLHSMYLANSLAVLRHYPVAYARGEAIAWFTYFLPASEMHYFDVAREKIRGFDRAFNIICFGQLRHAESRKDLRSMKASGNTLGLIFYTSIFLMVLLPILAVWGCAQWLPSRRHLWRKEQLAALGLMLYTIAFITGVSNALSPFENNRYRFPLDGFYLVLAGLLITRSIESRVPRPSKDRLGTVANAQQ